MASPKFTIAPPTSKQLDGLRIRLRAGMFLEHAAALEGIPARMVLTWVKLGRQGKSGFVEFVDMIDRQTAEIAAGLIKPIYQAATEEGNLAAAQWLYKTRLGKREEYFQKKMWDAEEEIEAKLTENEAPDEAALAAAEERALAALDEGTEVH